MSTTLPAPHGQGYLLSQSHTTEYLGMLWDYQVANNVTCMGRGSFISDVELWGLQKAVNIVEMVSQRLQQ